MASTELLPQVEDEGVQRGFAGVVAWRAEQAGDEAQGGGDVDQGCWLGVALEEWDECGGEVDVGGVVGRELCVESVKVGGGEAGGGCEVEGTLDAGVEDYAVEVRV